MEDSRTIVVSHLEKIHTTEMGKDRIKRNLDIDVIDVVEWCKHKINDTYSSIKRIGKNWYITIENYVITVHAHSYTIITAHKLKKRGSSDSTIIEADSKGSGTA